MLEHHLFIERLAKERHRMLLQEAEAERLLGKSKLQKRQLKLSQAPTVGSFLTTAVQKLLDRQRPVL